MEYILKEGNQFKACIGEVSIDRVRTFHSRINFKGLGDEHVSVEVGDFQIEWLSNFGYGSWSFGSAIINFKGIFIRDVKDVTSTSDFVNILNFYSNLPENEKDNIIIELANALAHFRETNPSGYNSFGNNPRYLKPLKSFDELPEGINKEVIRKLNSMDKMLNKN